MPLVGNVRHDRRRGKRPALGGRLVNNAPPWTSAARAPAKAALVLDVNARGTLLTSLACVDALRESGGAMVTLSLLDLAKPEWIAAHPHYTVGKYG